MKGETKQLPINVVEKERQRSTMIDEERCAVNKQSTASTKPMGHPICGFDRVYMYYLYVWVHTFTQIHSTDSPAISHIERLSQSVYGQV